MNNLSRNLKITRRNNLNFFSIDNNLNNLNSIRRQNFSSTNLNKAKENFIDYYKILNLNKSATKKEIKESFYELSKLYHPDAASTSSSKTIEENTTRFHSLSEAYSILNDDVARRNYDRSLLGYHRPTYTSATTNSQSGFGGGSASSWSSENNSRRERANYAWSHPSRRNGESSTESAAASARARVDPFSNNNNTNSNNGFNNTTTMDDHFNRFAKQQARTNHRTQTKGTRFANTGSPFSSGAAGFSGFGAKAEEESRLVNDSGVKRSGQVFLVFGGCFALAIMLSSGKNSNSNQDRDRRNRK